MVQNSGQVNLDNHRSVESRSRTDRSEPTKDPDVVLPWPLAVDGGPEGVPEALGRVIIDDRVDARVEVGETVADDADGAIEIAFWQAAKVGDEQMHVHRKPENGEEGDDGDQQTTSALFPATARCRDGRCRSADGEAGHPVAIDVAEDPDGEDSDDRQRE